jgi:flagellar M-ring protein FliF
MGGLLNTWTSLPVKSRAILLVAVIATFLGIIVLASWAQRPTLGMLYAGLEPSDAGRVVGELEQMKVVYEVRGDAIYVDLGVRDKVRMSLAERGLPRRGPAGYELLDDLNGFGTTTEMFDATYWRAKEGELARTILALPGVAEARVHIASAKRRAFARQGVSSSAAVTVRTGGGYTLQMRHALAIRYLVALAVSGLSPDQVAVIDADGGVLLRPGGDQESASGLATAAEHERRLSREIMDLLSVRVGEGRSRVQVAVEIDRESEAVSERIVDPDSRVAIHSNSEELNESSTGGSRGAVTVTSNLPDGDARAGSDGGKSNRTETRESVNYEVSEVQTERRKEAGSIKRVSVAVLIDGVRQVADDGTETWEPRTEEEIEILHQLVQSAVGYDETRGDVVTVRSLKFTEIAENGDMIARPSMLDRILDHAPQLIQAGILALVIILVALFVIRPLFQRDPAARNSGATLLAGAGDELTHLQSAAEEPDDGHSSPDPPELLPQTPTSLLKSLANERPEETTGLIKSWLSASPEQEEPV